MNFFFSPRFFLWDFFLHCKRVFSKFCKSFLWGHCLVLPKIGGRVHVALKKLKLTGDEFLAKKTTKPLNLKHRRTKKKNTYRATSTSPSTPFLIESPLIFKITAASSSSPRTSPVRKLWSCLAVVFMWETTNLIRFVLRKNSEKKKEKIIRKNVTEKKEAGSRSDRICTRYNKIMRHRRL